MAWGSKGTDTGARSSGAGALSFIGTEVTITGNLDGSGNVHIDGTVQGDVSCAQLTLGASGMVKGNIVAARATLAGTVQGAVSVGELTVEKSAHLTGDLSYDTISIENGAKVDGRLALRTSAGAAGELKLVSAINE